MKNAKNKKKRISEQIVKKSISVVMAIFLVIAVVTLTIMLIMTTTANETELTLESESASYQLEDYFGQYTRVTEQMAVNTQIRELLSNTGKGQIITKTDGYANVYENMQNIAGIDSNILAAWVGDIDASVLTQSDGYTSSEDWDITQRPWYRAAQENITMLTEPYVDASTGQLIVSAASPICDESGNVLGVAGLDISIDQITEMLGSRKIGDKGYLMLFSSDGMTIYHPSEDNIQKNVSELGFSDALVQAVTSDEECFMKYQTSEDVMYGYVIPVGDTGLIVVSGLPRSEYFETIFWVIIAFIFIFAAGIAIVIIAMKKVAVIIAKPVMELNDTAQKLAAGDLDVTINIKSEDEIGELGHSIQATVNRLKEYINYIDEISEVLDRLASGKLAIQLKYDYVGEFQKVKVALQNISSSMMEVMTGIRTSAMQVSTGADDLSLASQGLAEGSQNQAAAVEELVATSAAVMEQVEQNKQEAEQSAGRTQEVANMMAESERRMNEMLKAMKTIEETSGQVVGVIQAIEEIATQTNLLALNASIEAARAGEAGKGFAVVAGEIGGLADESAKAVNTTRELIGISMDEIKHGMKLVEEVGESIRNSTEAVAEVNGMIKKTTENAVYQAQNIEQINQGVEDISNAVQDNSAMAEESSATSEELASQATLLNSLVQRFELE